MTEARSHYVHGTDPEEQHRLSQLTDNIPFGVPSRTVRVRRMYSICLSNSG